VRVARKFAVDNSISVVLESTDIEKQFLLDASVSILALDDDEIVYELRHDLQPQPQEVVFTIVRDRIENSSILNFVIQKMQI
jgi:hypothetical protein